MSVGNWFHLHWLDGAVKTFKKEVGFPLHHCSLPLFGLHCENAQHIQIKPKTIWVAKCLLHEDIRADHHAA